MVPVSETPNISHTGAPMDVDCRNICALLLSREHKVGLLRFKEFSSLVGYAMEPLEVEHEGGVVLLHTCRRVGSMAMVSVEGLIDGFLEPVADLIKGGCLHSIADVVGKGRREGDVCPLKTYWELVRLDSPRGNLKVLEVVAGLPILIFVSPCKGSSTSSSLDDDGDGGGRGLPPP